MLPSIKELLAFGSQIHDAPGSTRSSSRSSTQQHSSHMDSSYLQRQPIEEPTTPDASSSSFNAKQRPGRKAGSSDRYTASPGARQYRCGVQSCAALFKRPEHLKRHMLTHTQDRPYHCDAKGCGKRFSRRDNYITHTKKHGVDDNGTPSREESTPPSAAMSGGHKRTASDMTHGTVGNYAVGSSNSDSGEYTGYSTPAAVGSPALRPISSIFDLLNSDSDGVILPASAATSSLPPLELLAYASTQAGMPTSEESQKQQHLSQSPSVAEPKHQKQRKTIDAASSTNIIVASVADGNGGDPTKPFMCPLCDSRFGRLEHVKRHQLVHTGQRQFECPTCNKSFARKDNMAQHVRAHERKKTVQASVAS